MANTSLKLQEGEKSGQNQGPHASSHPSYHFNDARGMRQISDNRPPSGYADWRHPHQGRLF